MRALAQTLGEKETYRIISQFMNVLTIVSVIVLPLSLITGFYGMNFQAYMPSGKMVHPYNMPEFYSPLGYFGVGPFSAEALKDPICGMIVGVAGARYTVAQGDDTVYFCGPGCKEAYELKHAD